LLTDLFVASFLIVSGVGAALVERLVGDDGLDGRHEREKVRPTGVGVIKPFLSLSLTLRTYKPMFVAEKPFQHCRARKKNQLQALS
jgi:hypothetical protein